MDRWPSVRFTLQGFSNVLALVADYPAETDAEDVSDDNILSPYTSCVAKDSPLESKDGDKENVNSDKNNGGGASPSL